MEKTISVVVGKGSIGHNNRDFLTDNIDKERIKDNVVFVQQDLKDAYEELFAEAIQKYNVGKKPSRQKNDYMKEIENSGNGEKIFQEIVVQIGDKDNTKLGSQDWEVTKEILKQYAKNFQSTNENVHVFNSVLHLDESTPHLHISFIPVAENYKTGLSKRNSFSKSMNDRFGTKEGVGAWFKHERSVLSELAQSRGIEIEVLGEDRPHLALKDYKETKDKIQELKREKIEMEENVNEITTDLTNQYNQKKTGMNNELNSLKTQIESRREELEDFKVEASKIENERTRELNERLSKQTELYHQSVQQMKDDFGDLKERAILQIEKSNLIQEKTQLKEESIYWQSESIEKDSIINNQNKIIEHQQEELNKKDKVIAKLQRTIEVAKEFIQEKASWLGGKFNEFFKNKATVEEIEVLAIQEQPRTCKSVELEIKDVQKTLNDLKNEELMLMFNVDDDLESVSEPKKELGYQRPFEFDSKDEWNPVNNDFVKVNPSGYRPVNEQKKQQPKRNRSFNLDM